MEKCHEHVRSKIEFAESDRYFDPDIDEAIDIIRSKELIRITNETAKEQKIDFKNEYHETFGIY